jgi:Zn-dependent protease with chaperone function/Zn-finger nucleic acid-binding protein
MYCPNCAWQRLESSLARHGVQIDYCDSCKGTWLDKGELHQLARDPRRVTHDLMVALSSAKPSPKLSPRSGGPMQRLTYPGDVPVEYCTQTGGLWFDGGKLKAVLAQYPKARDGVDPSHLEPPPPAKSFVGVVSRLLPLPNLVLRSVATITGIYAFVGLAIVLLAEMGTVRLSFALYAALGITVFQFLISPLMLDFSLNFLFSIRWVKLEAAPPYVTEIIRQVCDKQGIEPPMLGIIEDGAPEAFTYGWGRNGARIVISRGLFDILTPREVQAVVAHELGHIVHRDFILMSIVQAAPLILYYIYRSLRRSRDKGAAIAVTALGLYILSQYGVLGFSRNREYHADRFSGEATGDPSLLASALTKIGYGLARQAPAAEDKSTETATSSSSSRAASVGALGIFDVKTSAAMAITGYGKGSAPGATVERDLKDTMRWDLWNPWATWFELNSTHPLVANRLRFLSNQSASMGKPPFVEFDDERPESYWDEFLLDLIVYLLPVIAPLVTFFAMAMPSLHKTAQEAAGATFLAMGLALLLRYAFSYRSGFFPAMSIAALLKQVKVSEVRPVCCTVTCTIIGRGVPGYVFSEDFVARDETGIIFLDYRQPLRIWEFLFGALKAEDYVGKEVVVEGWYRRAPIPMVEIRSLKQGDKTIPTWLALARRLTALLVIALGLFLLF